MKIMIASDIHGSLKYCRELIEKYREEYKHPIWKKYGDIATESGHGGMDYMVLSAFFESVKTGAPVPIDVYDAASWMAISALSEDSIACGGAPVAASGGIAEGVQTTGVVGVDPSVLASQIASTPVIPGQPFNGMSPEMEEATRAYVEQLNELTETLKQVAEQSARLTRDSEEMETMNRTLTGINRFYEMQLRSVSNQSNTVDEVHEQTKRLAEQLDELNGVYARMVEALKVNMK